MSEVIRNQKPAKKEEIRLDELTSRFLKIYLDLKFQRPLAWEQKNKNGFICSILTESGNVNFCIASTKDCARYCEENGDEAGKMYFFEIAKRWKWISIDGNNRVNTLYEFLNKELEIDFGKVPYEIDVYNDEGECVKTIDGVLGKSTYENLPTEFKEYFDSRLMSIEELVGASREDCQRKFQNINNNVALTAQELRTATMCAFADSIRQTAVDNQWISEKIKKLCVKGRVLDEFILYCIVHFGRDEISGITPTDLNAPYIDASCQTHRRRKNSFRMLKDALMLYKKGDLKNEIQGKHLLFNWIMIYSHWTNSSFEFDGMKLFKRFLGVQNDLTEDDTPLVKDGTQSYTFMGCNTAFNGEKMNARFHAINEKLLDGTNLFVTTEVAEDVDETYTGERDPQRFYTPAQRLELWIKQGGTRTTIGSNNEVIDGTDAICPESGESIPYYEIWRGDLWEADHEKPWSKGGLTTIENGRLIKKIYNRVKSDS